ncbi:MAG: type II toxin-antitoxin system prevent-host-death family antitoxin [Nitrospirae bacterium]|nr:type II toxin-antitoxin system prevent-host-death family antitoxin [Nitrospirota bacterium]
MKFVTVRELKQKTTEIWRLVKKGEELVITSNGKPIALLTGISEDTLEDDLDTIRRVSALKSLDRIHRESLKKGTYKISMEEIDREIKKVRRKQKGKQ